MKILLASAGSGCDVNARHLSCGARAGGLSVHGGPSASGRLVLAARDGVPVQRSATRYRNYEADTVNWVTSGWRPTNVHMGREVAGGVIKRTGGDLGARPPSPGKAATPIRAGTHGRHQRGLRAAAPGHLFGEDRIARE